MHRERVVPKFLIIYGGYYIYNLVKESLKSVYMDFKNVSDKQTLQVINLPARVCGRLVRRYKSELTYHRSFLWCQLGSLLEFHLFFLIQTLLWRIPCMSRA